MSDQYRATNGTGDPAPTDNASHSDTTSLDGDDPLGANESDESASAMAAGAIDDASVLRTRVRRLEEENRRLRDKYAGAREKRYVRTALGLAGVGLGFGLAGLVVTSAQEVLFAIAAAGLFGAVLTRFLTPEQFIPLDIGEGIYAALADNEASLVDQLGLSSTRVYLSTTQGPRLFVPELAAYDRSLLTEETEENNEQFDQPLVVSDSAARSGIALRPAAEPLLRAFEEQHRGDLPETPREAVATLEEGVTDALELAAGVEVDLDSSDGRVTVAIDDPLYGDVTGFDHPIASFLGTGLATALGTPVEVDVVTIERAGDVTPLVTCRWDPADIDAGDDGGPESEAAEGTESVDAETVETGSATRD